MPSMPNVAITGANGYVGSIIAQALSGYASVIPLVRSPKTASDRLWSLEMSEQDMVNVLQRSNVTHIVHSAWDMRENSHDKLARLCVAGTRRLLTAARAAGTRPMIFISSISAFNSARSAYGQSKFAAENIVLAAGGVVLRLGLVYGACNGGVFGSLAALARRFPLIPNVRGGSGVQFMLHERSLAEIIVRAVQGDFWGERRVLTLAHPNPIRLSDLLHSLTAAAGRKVVLVPVPWQLIYLLLRSAEIFRLPLDFRSDSLLGFIYQDPQPDFAAMRDHRIVVPPFASRCSTTVTANRTS
jgi:nucleoside-diphosphate-sugar epimerase